MTRLKNKTRLSLLGLFSGLFFVLLFIASSVGAQNLPPAGRSGVTQKSLEKSRPTPILPTQDLPKIQIPKREAPPPEDTGPSLFVREIQIEGNTIFDEATLAPLVAIGEGRKLTFGQLRQLANRLTRYYAEKGYILTEAFFPKQKVVDGRVRVTVVEGRYGKILIKGNENLDTEDLQARFEQLSREGVVREQSLEKVLLQLNDMLGVNAKSTLKPGELPGTADLVVEISESEFYGGGFDADNFGSRFTGTNRFGVSGVASHILGLGDRVYFRGIKSDDDLSYANASYLYFLHPSGTSVKFDYIYSEFGLGFPFQALNAGGEASIFRLQFSQPLYRTRQVQVNLRAGGEYRTYENFQLSTITNDDDLGDIFVGLGGNFRDAFLGYSIVDVNLQQGFTETDTNRPDVSRTGGTGDVFIARFEATRYQSISILDSYFILKGLGQWAGHRVLIPDQFAMGGVGTVRGYPLAEFAADNGYAFSAEYVLPFPVDVPLGFNNWNLRNLVSFSAFYDLAGITYRDRISTEQDEMISGWGVGIRLNVPKPFDKKWVPTTAFTFSYARPLSGPIPTDGSDDVLYFSGAVNF